MASPPRADSDFDGQRQCPIPKTSSKMLRGKLGGESLFYPTMGWRPAIQQLEPLKAGGKPIVFFFFPSEGNMLRGGNPLSVCHRRSFLTRAPNPKLAPPSIDERKREVKKPNCWARQYTMEEHKNLGGIGKKSGAKKKEKEIFFSLLKYTAIYIYIYIRIGLRSRNRRVCQLWKCCILQRERKPRRWQLREAAAYPFRV